MAAKTLQTSLDDTNYFGLPGNSGDISLDAANLDDTIFGQNYLSNQPGLIKWSVKAQAFFKGFAGYVCKLNLTGAAITITAEACTLVSGKTYKITNTIKQCIDPNTVIVVFDNAVDQTANVLNVDYLFGRITFKAAYTVTGPVTITGKYLPVSAIASAQSFTLGMTAAAIDTSDLVTVQGNSGLRTFSAGLNTVSLDLKGVYALSNAWRSKLTARSILMVEIIPDGTTQSVARGFFLVDTQSLSGNVGALELESLKLVLNVPATLNSPSLLLTPFNWLHTATTLSTAVQQILTSFLASTPLFVKYLSDGVAGAKGSAVITDCSLSSGIDAMNQFTANFQGTGALTII